MKIEFDTDCLSIQEICQIFNIITDSEYELVVYHKNKKESYSLSKVYPASCDGRNTYILESPDEAEYLCIEVK